MNAYQVFLVQKPSPAASHVTMVAGLTWHLNGCADLSQISVPLHRLPSSWPAQSLVCWQAQVLLPPTHEPPLQESPAVQPLPSSQLAVLLVKTQPDVLLQLSLVHALPSSHTVADVPLQPPPAHASPVVQASPSVHGRLLLAWAQPVVGEQLSLVHKLPSSQLAADPAQTLLAHVSPWVQALPSSHDTLLAALTQPVETLHESLVHGLPSLQFLT